MTISICILNRNQKDLLKACIKSCLDELKGPGLAGEVIVVDNASQDGSPEMVAQKFPQVRLIRNRDNAPFSTANNQAIAASSGRYVFILNNDTVLHPGCLGELVRYMDAHPEVGVAGPKLLDRDGSIQLGYHRRLPRLPDTLLAVLWLYQVWPSNPVTRRALLADELLDDQQQEPWPIEQVGGCAMLLRRATLQGVGVFDENFNFWYEDVDLCERISKSQWKIRYVPKSRVVHYGGASFGAKEHGDKMIWQTTALLEFYRKHRGRLQYSIVKLATLASLAMRLPLAMALAWGPKAVRREQWRNAPTAYLRALRTTLLS